MTVILFPLLQLLDVVLELYQIVLIVWIVLSWLVSFNVVNTANGFVRGAMNVLWAADRAGAAPDPALRADGVRARLLAADPAAGDLLPARRGRPHDLLHGVRGRQLP